MSNRARAIAAIGIAMILVVLAAEIVVAYLRNRLLHVAAARGDKDTVEHLISKGGGTRTAGTRTEPRRFTGPRPRDTTR